MDIKETGLSFLTLDQSGVVDYVSEECSTLLMEDPIGSKWSDLYIKTFTPMNKTYHLLSNGKYVDIKINLSNITTIFIHDITEILDLSNAISKKSRISSMAEMSQSISHQIKTPLSVILMQSEMIEEEAPEVSQRTDKIARNVDLISELLTSFFKFGASAQTSPEINSSMDLLSSVKSVYDSANIKILGDDVNFIGNKDMLVSAISNLVDNTITENPAAPIKIESERTSATSCKITYSDEAGGLSNNADLFKKHRPNISKNNSWGVGMSITKFIIEAHGGSIQYANRPNSGIDIVLTIPTEASLANINITE